MMNSNAVKIRVSVNSDDCLMVRTFPTLKAALKWVGEYGCTNVSVTIQEIK